MIDLFESHLLGATVPLKNRIVMAPMTRTRTSDGDVPNELMATYYRQRAGAGLIVTEATDVAPSSKGYAMTPGIYTEAQRQGWRLVTDQVHRNICAIVARRQDGPSIAHAERRGPLGCDRGKG